MIRRQLATFELRLREGDTCYIEVKCPAGEATAPVEALPLLRAAEDARYYDGAARDVGRRPDADAEVTPDFGQELFRGLLGNREVGQLLATSLALAADRGQDLRLIWQTDTASSFSAVPLERLCDPAGARPFAVDPGTPVVRALPAAVVMEPVGIEVPVRILVVASSPLDVTPVSVEAELEAIRRELKPLTRRGLVKIEIRIGASLQELSRVLSGDEFHLLHFVGHGFFLDDGGLVLDGEKGGSEQVEKKRLEVLLAPLRSLRVIILNCCSSAESRAETPRSGLAQAISRLRVPAVVGMGAPVSDRAAVGFAAGFYRSLAAGRALDAAVNAGRLEMRLTHRKAEDWASPILFLRNPHASSLFCLPRAPPPIRPAPAGSWAVDRLLDPPGRAGLWLACGTTTMALATALTGLWFAGVFLYQLGSSAYYLRREAWLAGGLAILAGPLFFDFWRGVAARLWRRRFPLAAVLASAAGLALFALFWLLFLGAAR